MPNALAAADRPSGRERMSRRLVLRRLVTSALLAMGASTVTHADELGCEDGGPLTPRDQIRRKSLAYVPSSPDGSNASCANCRFFRSTSLAHCGSCSVVPGPIHPMGSCRLFAKP